MVATATIRRNGAATFGATIAKPKNPAFIDLATIVATIAKRLIWAIPVYIVAHVALDSAAGQSEAWKQASIGFTVVAAIFAELAFESHSWGGRAVWAFAAVIFICLDIITGVSNSAATSDHARDVSSSQSSKKGRLTKEMAEWSQRRKAMVAVIEKRLQSVRGMEIALDGEAPVKSIEAEIEATKTAKAGYWRASEGCKTEKLFSLEAKAFCREIADLEAKRDAAEKRDELDRSKPKAADDVTVQPATVDGYIAVVNRVLKAAGYKVDDPETQDLIARSWDWVRGIGLSIFGALAPYALLRWLGLAHQPHQAPRPESQPQPQPQAQRKPEKAPKASLQNPPATIPVIVATSQSDDPEFNAFRASRLEDTQGRHAPSTPIFKAWEQHCAERGIEPGSQKAFCQRLQASGIGYDRNNGRPRYLNVRLKSAPVRAEHSGLRLAVNNA